MLSDERTCSNNHSHEREETESVSFRTRRKILLVLAIIGCSAVLVVGVQDAQNSAVSEFDDDLLGAADDMSSKSGSPVILEQQSSALETALRRLKKNKGKKYCDHAVSFRQISFILAGF
jgi:flagellar biogenesis protein FliO